MSWLPRKTVVVPVDFSDDSFASLSTALDLVEDPSHVRLVHVLPVLAVTDPGVIWATIDDTSRIDHATGALNEELDKRGFDRLHIETRFGDPGHEIANYAQDIEAGLIVLCRHGQSAWKHLLIGAVAERVVRLAHCPVLVLKH